MPIKPNVTMIENNLGNLFYGQFLFSERPDCPFPDWVSLKYRSRYLHYHPILNLHNIFYKGNIIGFYLGFVIDDEAGLLESGHALHFKTTKGYNHDSLEEFIYSRGGRFICLITFRDSDFFYLDPAGSLSCIYSSRKQTVASTNTLLHFFEDGKLQAENPVLGKLKSNQFYPAGLTHEKNIFRLLPNHYLDLQTWTYSRHWPNEFLTPFDEKTSWEAMDEIATQLKSNISAVLFKYPTYIGITGGRDTRVLLACCRDFSNRVSTFTFDYGDWHTKHDVESGVQVANIAGLPHQVLPVHETNDATKLIYLKKIGYNGHYGKSRDFLQACADLDLQSAFLTGFSGEVCRANYRKKWKYVLSVRKRSIKSLLALCYSPDKEPEHTAMKKWLDSVKELMDKNQILDLLYLEQRVGCWASVHYYGFSPFLLSINVFSHRRIYSNMIKLCDNHKVNEELYKYIINKYWPELAELPFNKNKPFFWGKLRGFLRYLRMYIGFQ